MKSRVTMPPREKLFYISLVVAGCIMFGRGLLLTLIHEGVLEDGTKVAAIVDQCGATQRCKVHYEIKGVRHVATYRSIKETHDPGTPLTVLHYSGRDGTVYPVKPVNIGFGIVFMVVGIPVTAYGCVRLYRYLKVQNPAPPPAAS